MITFDEKGLHFDVDLTQDDVTALEAYTRAVRINERVAIIQFLDGTLPRPEATPEQTDAPADAPTEEAPVEEAPAAPATDAPATNDEPSAN